MALPDYTNATVPGALAPQGAASNTPSAQPPVADPYAGMSRTEVAQYTNDPEALNKAATADFALRDAATAGVRGPHTGYQAYDLSGAALRAIPTGVLPAKDPRRFADGGKPETADELMARINAKYGVSGKAPPASVPVAPTQQPQPAPQAGKQPGSLIQQAAGLLGGRAQQIDKAVNGYACGGKPMKAHAQGGKIKGPGTPTSDSIPAKVPETGEDILVSTEERILSKKQDELLDRIAKALGLESVDQLLEIGTGQPVGPTIKGGKQAAAMGGKPGYTDENGVYHPASMVGSASAPLLEDDGPAPGVRYATGVTPNQVGPLAMMAQAYGGQLDKLLGPNADERRAANRAGLDTTQEAPVPTPVAQVAAKPSSVGPQAQTGSLLVGEQPIAVPSAQVLTTKDVIPGGYTDRGAGVVGSRGQRGQLNVTNVGTEGITDRASPIVDGSASALVDQKNSTYNPARQLENMQRLRLQSDLTNPEITDPNAHNQAVQGLAILNAGRAGADASATAQENLAQARAGTEMRGKLLDPNTTPEEQARIVKALQAIHGKADTPSFDAHVVKGQLGEPDTLVTFDKRTGRPVAGGTGTEIMAGLKRAAAPAVPALKDYADAVRKHPKFAGQTLTDEQINQMYQATYKAQGK